MALKKGICKNFDNCPLADSGEIQEVDSTEFVCQDPQCGKPLYEVTPPPPPKPWWLWLIYAIGIISVVFIAILLWPEPKQKYTITTQSNDEQMGCTIGGGEYTAEDTLTIKACANGGYVFSYWGDSTGAVLSNDSVWTITVVGDASYTAFFEKQKTDVALYSIKVVANDNRMGTVKGGGTFKTGEMATIIATAKEGYEFSFWSDGNGVVCSKNAVYNVDVNNDQTYMAFFVKEDNHPNDYSSLAYGKYTGPRDANGEPHGKGGRVEVTIEYHWGYYVFSPGDRIMNAVFENGQLRHGKVITKTGSSYEI